MRLIDADKLMWRMGIDSNDRQIFFVTGKDIDEQPTIEAAPVVHGRWEDKPTGRYGQQQSWCSACRKHSGIGGIEKNRHRAYCPNCGAKMNKEVNADAQM